MKKIKTSAILAMAVTLGSLALSSPVSASNDCSARKKSIDAKLSSRGLKNYTLKIVDEDVSMPGKIVGRCDNKTRKIIYNDKDSASGMIEEAEGVVGANITAKTSADVRTTADAKIAMDAKAAATAKAAVDVKAAAAAKAASEAAAADAKAAAAANAAAEAKAAANRAAADARAAAIEAKAAADARAAVAAKAAAESKAAADAAANEAKAAAEAKATADAWAANAAKAAVDAAAAAAKAAAEAKVAADLKTAANARVTAADLKAAADARVAANARAAADALDPADAVVKTTAVGAAEARTANAKAAPNTMAAADVKTPADTKAAAGLKLQYDGVYRAPINVGGRLFWKYFRFYADGTFITVRSLATAEQLRSWFVRDEPDNERGTFKIQGARILFFASQGETSNYDGSIEADQIRINVYSQIAQGQRSDIYEFVKWSDDKSNSAAAAEGNPTGK